MFDATFWTVLIAATLTAVATGLGALPFLFVRRLSLFWVSIANAAAGGFMFAATHSLVAEGVTISPARLVAGMVIGLVGILIGCPPGGGFVKCQHNWVHAERANLVLPDRLDT
jgi:hypothetical protein